jgi:hypothetical protein
VFAHGHQSTQAFGKDGFVTKSVHGRKQAMDQSNKKRRIVSVKRLLGF